MDYSENLFESYYLEENDAVKIPRYDGKHYLINGEIREWHGKFSTVYSPIYVKGKNERISLGQYPMLTEKEALEALESAVNAFNYGQGTWPKMSVKERIFHVEKYVSKLKENKDMLMWEICKTSADAQKEVDRTIKYIEDTIEELKKLENKQSTFTKSTHWS